MNVPEQTPPNTSADAPARRGIGCLGLTLILIGVVALTVVLTLWAARTWLYPPVEPVTLSAAEEQALEVKLQRLGMAVGLEMPRDGETASPPPLLDLDRSDGPLLPELYEETPDQRVILLSQREVNALLARDPQVAERLAVHLSDGMVSATWLVPVPPEVPLFGGRDLRVSSGVRLGMEDGRPQMRIEGVSVMGVPLPAAWIGDLKGQDLLGGEANAFFESLGRGISDLRVEQGQLRIELAQ